MNGINFIQIYYRDSQLSEIYPFAQPFFNQKVTHFFENSVIAELVPKSEAEKTAICSWKLKNKLKNSILAHLTLTKEHINMDYDVLALTRNTKYHNMIAMMENWHPGTRQLLSDILTKIGFWIPGLIKQPVYQNHFVAKTEIYKRYVSEMLLPAMEVMETDPDIKDRCWKDSGYTALIKTGEVSLEYLQEQIGVPYYPLHAFLLERCFSIWCDISGIKITYL